MYTFKLNSSKTCIVAVLQVTNACKEHGGFYLGSIGGPAAILAQNCIKKVEVLEYPELGGRIISKHLIHVNKFCQLHVKLKMLFCFTRNV